jgi:NTP pyrophosphatase (non-canonical NTP hydrolase)
MQSIISEIEQERKRQDLKFGTPPRSRKPALYLAVLMEEVGEIARSILEGDSDNYRIELIQVAAVAVAALQDFDYGNSTYAIESICKPIVYRNDKLTYCCEMVGDCVQYEFF